MPDWFQQQRQYDPLLEAKLRGLVGTLTDDISANAGSFDYARERQDRDAAIREIFAQQANPEFSAGDIPGMILGAPGRLVQGLVGGITGRGGGGGAADYWADRPDLKMQLATGVSGLPETSGNRFTDAITGVGQRRATNMRGLLEAVAARRKLVDEPAMEDRYMAARTAGEKMSAALSGTGAYENLATTEYGRGQTNSVIGENQAQATNALAHAALANRQGAGIDPREKLWKIRKEKDEAKKRKLELRKLQLQGRAAATGQPDPYGVPQPKAEGGLSDEQRRLHTERLTTLGKLVGEGAAEKNPAIANEISSLNEALGTNATITPGKKGWISDDPATLTFPENENVAVRKGDGEGGMEDAPPQLPRGNATAALAGHKGKKYDSPQAAIDAHNRNQLSYDELVVVLEQDFGMAPRAQ